MEPFIDEAAVERVGRGLVDRWTRERLYGVEARRGWVEPDLKPLPH